MAGFWRKAGIVGGRRHGQVPAFLIGALLLLFAAAAAGDEADTLSEADKQCLGCHGTEGLKKALADGSTLSLHVQGGAFARSVHRMLGCAGCHGDIDLKSHPGAAKDIKSARQYAIERAEGCRLCHEESAAHQEKSVHAARLREGSPVAPVCTGCHGSHTVTPKTAYDTCVACHSAALAAHRQWLPNAQQHHEVVSCAACHAPAVLRMTDLRLYDRVAKGWVSEKESAARFEKLARSVDADGNGLDAAELRKLLNAINQDTAAPQAKVLRGRIELRSGTEAHLLSDKREAIRSCDSCHRYGAEPFKNVAVSVTGPDGRPVRYPASNEVLTAALALESLPEFYAIGGTRSRLLDVLFVLVLLGGAGIPVAHFTIRWLSRKYRAQRGRHDASGNPDDRNR